MLNKKALAATAAGAEAVYVEDVFSTYLYTGTGSAQTITNNIDLSGEGGLVWIKSRSNGLLNNVLMDTARGVNQTLRSDSTSDQSNESSVTAFNSNGFTLGTFSRVSNSSDTFVSWTFRKAEKFFDVVTYTGNGVAGREISHNLGSAPGFVVVKITSNTGAWNCIHRQSGSGWTSLQLNATAGGSSPSASVWGDGSSFVAPTSTNFTVGSIATNTNGETYVAYLFAHDAGGFGDAGDQNVISCGSFTTDGSGAATVTLGYEPQWALFKCTTTSQDWFASDSMRGMPVGSADAYLVPNTSAAESTYEYISPTATGFTISNQNTSATYIYIAIRRGPMKTPEVGTEVLSMDTQSSFSTNELIDSNFPPDMFLAKARTDTSAFYSGSKLTGGYLTTNTTNAETSGLWKYDGAGNKLYATTSYTGTPIYWQFRRSKGFFDVVCYAGNGSTQSVSHNLGVTPELIIVKWRSGGATSYGWRVYHKDQGITKWGQFTSDAFSTASSPYPWDTPTSSVFKLGDGATWFSINGSSKNFVAYLFATVAGVSKVGSYTGNGSNQTINCGFTTGARFVLIKRTDSTGDWVVFDSARGIVSGNDPYLELNTTDAEVTDKDAIDTDSTGFVVNETTGPNINTNSATYIYLAIA